MSHQSMQALDRGREVRERRSRLKRELKAGEARLSVMLRDEIPDWLASMDAERLLLMAPRVGTHAMRSLLLEARLGPRQEARHITVRQRSLLAAELERIENLQRRSR